MPDLKVKSSLEFVRCGDAHIPEVIRLLHKLYKELDEGDDERVSFLLTEDAVKRMISRGVTTIIAACDEGRLVGIITLTESQAFYAGGPYGCIDELYVLPEYRSRRLGSSLLDEAKWLARTSRWQRIVVNTPKDRIRWGATLRFYERNGFGVTGNKLKFQL